MGSTVISLVQDPLAVTCLDNRLYIYGIVFGRIVVYSHWFIAFSFLIFILLDPFVPAVLDYIYSIATGLVLRWNQISNIPLLMQKKVFYVQMVYPRKTFVNFCLLFPIVSTNTGPCKIGHLNHVYISKLK